MFIAVIHYLINTPPQIKQKHKTKQTVDHQNTYKTHSGKWVISIEEEDIPNAHMH